METTFNQRLKKLMTFYELNQISLAKVTGLGNQTVNNLVNGSKPRYDTLIPLLKYFREINPYWLLMGEGEMLNKGRPSDELHEQPGEYNTRNDYDMLKKVWEKDRDELEHLRKLTADLTGEILKLCERAPDKKKAAG